MILHGGVRFPVDRPSPGNVSRLDHNVLPMIDAMHRNGIRVDVAHMETLGEQLGENMVETAAEIERVVGKRHAINPASPPQVAELLFKKLKVQGDRPVRLTDSGAESTGADQLQLYEDCHPVVKLILDWRHYQKLKGTYADKMAKLARRDPSGGGRVHTRFKVTRTATGRLASEDPNLQNIPTRPRKGLTTNWGTEIRRGFTATPGWVLVSMDLSQIEMRWAAHYSGEPAMVDGYNTPGFDMHSQTAKDCGLCGPLGCEPDDPVHKTKHRLPAKTIGFGVLYLMGAQGLQLAIVDAGGEYWEEAKCEALINRFYESRPRIRDWQQLQFMRSRRYGMVWDLFGRHRLIPQAKSVLGWQVREGEREGANMPIQSAAQGSLKVAMAHLHQVMHEYNRGVDGGPRVRTLLQVHDELIFEAKSDTIAQDWIGIAKPIMEGAVPLVVPVGSSADVAERWGDLK